MLLYVSASAMVARLLTIHKMVADMVAIKDELRINTLLG
jgi:hypothetical protein